MYKEEEAKHHVSAGLLYAKTIRQKNSKNAESSESIANTDGTNDAFNDSIW